MTRLAAAMMVVVLGATVIAADKPNTNDVLVIARTYALNWQNTLTNLVADEEYTQEVRRLMRGASGREQPLQPAKRQLRSEILLVQAPADKYWLSFRDVMSVDGKAVPNRQQRFHDLFGSPAAAIISTARLMAQESARYNLGRLFRTTNTPTAALVFLLSRHAANSTWRLDTGARLDGRKTWVLGFEQRKPPYAIELSGGRAFPPTGRFWLEPSTGTILQSELTVKGGYSASTRVRFGIVPSIDGMVPIRMEDDYHLPGLEDGRGKASYTNHRLFRTAGRVIGH